MTKNTIQVVSKYVQKTTQSAATSEYWPPTDAINVGNICNISSVGCSRQVVATSYIGLA